MSACSELYDQFSEYLDETFDFETDTDRTFTADRNEIQKESTVTTDER